MDMWSFPGTRPCHFVSCFSLTIAVVTRATRLVTTLTMGNLEFLKKSGGQLQTNPPLNLLGKRGVRYLGEI